MKKKTALFSTIAIVLALGLMGMIGTADKAAATGKYGGTLTKAFFAPGTLDPAFAADITGGEIPRFWADPLVNIDEEVNPDPGRSLAYKWEFSDDGLVWTFHLRKGVQFHNGEKFTSKDVKFTFDRLRDPKVGAATVPVYAGITDITTPDDYTVVFKLKEENPDFILT